jgi:hypothetical protein
MLVQCIASLHGAVVEVYISVASLLQAVALVVCSLFLTQQQLLSN